VIPDAECREQFKNAFEINTDILFCAGAKGAGTCSFCKFSFLDYFYHQNLDNFPPQNNIYEIVMVVINNNRAFPGIIKQYEVIIMYKLKFDPSRCYP
jgi:hypothetical protein